MSDLYKKLEEAAEVVNGTVGVLELLSKRIKQLESYLERYKAIINTIYKAHTEGGTVEHVLDGEVFDELAKLERELGR